MVPPTIEPGPAYPPLPLAAPRNGSATTGMICGIVGIGLQQLGSFATLIFLRFASYSSGISAIGFTAIISGANLVLALLGGILAVSFGTVGWRQSRVFLPLRVGVVQSVVGITLGIVLLGSVVSAIIFYLTAYLEYRIY